MEILSRMKACTVRRGMTTIWTKSEAAADNILDNYPMLSAYADRNRARPAFQAAIAKAEVLHHRYTWGPRV
jgi:glutathione S-transferase